MRARRVARLTAAVHAASTAHCSNGSCSPMRRHILGVLVVCAACAAPAGVRTGEAPIIVTPIKSELSPDQQVDHALSRLAYGARPGDVDRVKGMGLDRWIALQLAPERLADPSGDSLVATYPALAMPTSQLASIFREVQMARRDTTRRDLAIPTDERRMLQQSIGDVGAAKLSRAVMSERQLYEQLVDFWENHFSVFAGKGQARLF